ncbi:hypothetical protein ACLGIH_01650 [Streptomyces sp. HMX87]|uniref:hypothetical protein n=1 Tax=Streptomyces sp. HMX87 TaxID=3390849 RepID=UPI003A8BAB0C
MADGGRKRLGAVGGLLAGAVFASGIGLYATDSWPFRDSYCWGAWQENSGARFLGEDVLGESADRGSEESAPPSAERPRATCTVAVRSTVDDNDSDQPLEFEDKVTVEYGPVPEKAEARHAWLARYFHGSASPLPDGLDGLVAGDRAMLVLPEACDVDGRPSVVTIRSEGWGDGHLGKLAMPFTIGTYSAVARMLLDVANTGMAEAGCAPGEPLRTTSPLVTVAEDGEPAGKPLCRIAGVEFDFGSEAHYEQQAGAVTPGLQTCSVVRKSRGEPDEPAAQYVMAGGPRMTALFGGLPEGTAHGLTRTTCDGRQTVFYGHVLGGLAGDKAAAERSFENFVASVGNRIGCETGGRA